MVSVLRVDILIVHINHVAPPISKRCNRRVLTGGIHKMSPAFYTHPYRCVFLPENTANTFAIRKHILTSSLCEDTLFPTIKKREAMVGKFPGFSEQENND